MSNKEEETNFVIDPSKGCGPSHPRRPRNRGTRRRRAGTPVIENEDQSPMLYVIIGAICLVIIGGGINGTGIARDAKLLKKYTIFCDQKSDMK